MSESGGRARGGVREPRDAGGRVAVAALGAILAVTAAWFALALWPTSGATPDWVARTREVCFRPGDNGLPDAGGWLTLTGPPISLLLVLGFGWGGALRSGLGALAGRTAGRAGLAAVVVLSLVGLGAVGIRVAGATSGTLVASELAEPAQRSAPPVPLDRPAPALELVDQRGELRSLASLEGKTVLVTFAFGHCQSICPAVVREVLAARRRIAETGSPAAALIVTLDPWRDTPSRLPYLAKSWGLDDDSWVLGGEVESVERTLDAWGVARSRDLSNGDLIHPWLVYVVDPAGRLVYASSGTADELVGLAAGP